MASQEGRTEIVKYLVDVGADINISTIDGSTPLGVSIVEGHTDIVALLKTSASFEK
jgi:ankyrin repeat protein